MGMGAEAGRLPGGFIWFTTVLSFPVLLMNAIGGLVAGVWLLLLGKWKIVLLTLLISGLLAVPILSIVICLWLVLIGAPVAWIENRIGGKLAGSLSGFAMLTGISLTFSAWCAAAYWGVASTAAGPETIPMLLWSYGVACGPINYMQAKGVRRGEEISAALPIFLSFGYLLLLAIYFVRPPSLLFAFSLLAAFCAAGPLAALICGWKHFDGSGTG